MKLCFVFSSCLFGTFLYNSELQRVKEVTFWSDNYIVGLRIWECLLLHMFFCYWFTGSKNEDCFSLVLHQHSCKFIPWCCWFCDLFVKLRRVCIGRCRKTGTYIKVLNRKLDEELTDLWKQVSYGKRTLPPIPLTPCQHWKIRDLAGCHFPLMSRFPTTLSAPLIKFLYF